VEKRRPILSCTLSFLALIALAAVFTAGPSAGAAPRPLVRVQVPLHQTVSNLVRGRLVEKLTCVRACKTKTTIYIRARLARRLGFKDVHGTLTAIGSRSIMLAAGRPTKVRIPLDASSKKLMSKANLGIQVVGQVAAQAARPSLRRGDANWITFLNP
jgi:hypothetical protein